MSHITGFLFTTVSFLFIISVIVFIHEFGHYIVAKWAGVKITIFSIGFGHELFGWNDRSGTRWRVSALPFGGYVKMYGDASEASTPIEAIDSMSETEKQHTFHCKPLYKKALIVVAGPLFNFVLTITIMTVFLYTYGIPSAEPVIGEVMKDSSAAAAGLMHGDRILSVNDEKVVIFQDIPQLIMTNLGTPIILKLQRDGKEQSITLTPRQTEEKDDLGNPHMRPIIGITSQKITVDKSANPLKVVSAAIRATYFMCSTTLHGVGQIVSGARSAKELQGPLGIARLSGQAAEKGMFTVFWLMAMLSANLGLINLFPVPMLDGGHLLYYAVEAIQGRPLAQRFQEYGFRIGAALVVMIMAFAVMNDARNILGSMIGK